MKEGEKRDVLKSIRVLECFRKEADYFRLKATVDGIQAKNFIPDFESSHPWGTVEIQQARKTNTENKAYRTVRDLESPDFTYAREGTFECTTENGERALLNQMRLSTSCSGRGVYSGSLASPELNSFMKIGTISSGEAGKLEFEVSMPADADNSCSSNGIRKKERKWQIEL